MSFCSIRRNQPQSFPAPDRAVLLDWLQLHYGHHSGYVEIYIIEGNPKDNSSVSQQHWLYYHPDNPTDLVDAYCAAVKRYGNVYFSIGLYTEKRRGCQTVAYLPGIFVDDYTGRAPLSASSLLVTSQGNAQGFWYVPGGVSVDQFRQLGRAAAKATSGGANSSNAVHLIRPPGSVNRKPGRNNYVTELRVNPDQPRYTVDDLAQAFPSEATTTTTEIPDLTEAEQEKVAYWQEHIDHLLRDGLPRRIQSPKSQTYQLLTGQRDTVGGDASSSMRRAVLMRGLLLHGYPKAEAIALAMYLAPPARGQDDTWLLSDSARLFEKERVRLAEKYNPSASRPKGKDSPVKNTEPATPIKRERGRPKQDTLTADGLYLWYQQQGSGSPCKILLTVQQVADDLNVPRSQVERAKRELRQRGSIRRVVSDCHHYSWVELPHFSPFKNQPAQETAEYRTSEPETSEASANARERTHTGGTHARIVPRGVCFSSPTPLQVPASRPVVSPSLTYTIRELVTLLLNSKPNARFADVLAYAENRGYHNVDTLRFWFDQLKTQQRYEKNRQRIRNMTWSHIHSAIRNAESKIAECMKTHDRRLSFWRWYWMELREELQRRLQDSLGPTRRSLPLPVSQATMPFNDQVTQLPDNLPERPTEKQIAEASGGQLSGWIGRRVSPEEFDEILRSQTWTTDDWRDLVKQLLSERFYDDQVQ